MSTGQGGTGDGGSQAAQSATVAALQGAGVGQGLGQSASTSQPSTQQTESEFAQSFLKGLDPSVAEQLKPYVSQWDSGVTKKFEELHGELKPYKDLGDPDTLTDAMAIYQMMDENPQQVLNLLQQALQEEGSVIPQNSPVQKAPPAETQELPPELQQALAPLTEKLGMFEKVLEQLAAGHIERTTADQQAQEDKELDDYMSALEKKHGAFDPDYVMAKMLAGMDGDKAVEAYNTAIQSQVNGRSATPAVPTILGGGGSAPQGGQDISKASSKDVRALVAKILSDSNQA